MRKKILDALFPKTRQRILGVLLLHPDKWWYMSDLAQFLGVGASSLQRELASLVSADILELRREGNRVYYKAQKQCPVIGELQGLLIKTSGIRDALIAGLKRYFKEIEFAFIYGSIAKNEGLSDSDIDVFIIGNIGISKLAGALKKLEGKLGREVNPTVFTMEEFIEKKQEGFVKTVLNGPKIFLKGNDEGLESLVG